MSPTYHILKYFLKFTTKRVILTYEKKRADQFALDVLICKYRTGLDCCRGRINEYEAHSAELIHHTHVNNGNLSVVEGKELLGQISNAAVRMQAEHLSAELDPNCKEQGREGSATLIASIKKEATRPRNRVPSPNMSPLSATPLSAAQRINATEAKSKERTPYSPYNDSQSTKNTM